MAHFIASKKTSDATKVVVIFFKEVVRLHGLPRSITSGKDTRFIVHFWRTLWKKIGSKQLYSLAYLPKIDGKTEVLNKILGNLLRGLNGENHSQWDMVLAQVEFAYNDSSSKLIGNSHF